jgi:hypothetical protein
MKILITFFLLIASQSVFSEDDTKNINLKYGANSGGFGFGPAIEIKISKNITVGALYETISTSSGDVTGGTSGLGINARYYFTEALTQDIYIHTSYVTGTGDVSNDVNYLEVDASSINFTFGKTWMWDNFNLDSSIGIRSMSVGKIKKSSGVDASSLEDLDGLGLSVSFTVGYAF